MESETMEYALDQRVIYEHLGGDATGKIVGESGDQFIIELDRPLNDGTRATLVPSEAVRPLTCYWCRDTQKVYATPVTLGQYQSGDIPMVDCPCVKGRCTCCKEIVR
jgi:hypothetical protein